MSNESIAAGHESAPQSTTPTTSARPSGSSVQMKSALAGMPYALQMRALTPVQRKGGEDSASVHEAAAHGIASGGGALPHGSAIQQAFGSYDVSNVQAHTGGAAAEASQAMGAEAYASGNHIAFGNSPDLHTAAHEAAHVVQQQAGVSLSGGVGQSGDKYEQHADKVADAVVSGQSAEGLLGEMTGGAPVQKSPVQRRAIQRMTVQRTTPPDPALPPIGDAGVGLRDDKETSGPAWGADDAAQQAELAIFQGYLSNPTSHPAYTATFLPRVVRLFQHVGMDEAGAPAMAAQAWTQCFQTLQATDAETAAATTGGRTDLTKLKTKIAGATQTVVDQFGAVAAIVEPALNAQFLRCNSFAFWSKGCALHLAMNGGADLALETSALGGLFNGLNIMGDGNIQMWAGLSTYYARAIVNMAKGKQVRVFVGPGAAPKNIYTDIEFPELETAFNNNEISITNYACAPLVETLETSPGVWEMKVNEGEHDPKETVGGLPGTYDHEDGGIDARTNMIGIADREFAARKAAATADVATKNTPPATPPTTPPVV